MVVEEGAGDGREVGEVEAILAGDLLDRVRPLAFDRYLRPEGEANWAEEGAGVNGVAVLGERRAVENRRQAAEGDVLAEHWAATASLLSEGGGSSDVSRNTFRATVRSPRNNKPAETRTLRTLRTNGQGSTGTARSATAP